ncbi:acyl-CoA dehydrogenase family protein [Paenibacillus sp. FSL H8-0537]|uniref:acyl-CoA dehydrogenase family protein n=1 Tax=Paenibacillus sp. FSL H8-0537 TaxID=2921399 RepID=UPI0031015B2E
MYEDLRVCLKDFAAEYRSFALEADRLGDIPAAHLANKEFRQIWMLGTPQQYGNTGIKLSRNNVFYGNKSLEMAICTEELSYGDPAMALSMPGAQLLGPIVMELGTEEQKSRFFESLTSSEPIWTGFNLTEPDAGSDVSGLHTVAVRTGNGGYVLTGEKRYIANAKRAQWVAVFAKLNHSQNPLAIQCFLLHESEFVGSQCTRLSDHTLGMRAAELGYTQYHALEICEDSLLGIDKSALRRGLHGAVNVFFRMRPCTASIAIGLSRAMIDYASEHLSLNVNETISLQRLQWKMEKTRRLVYNAASEVDRGVFDVKTSSMAKWMSNALVYEVSRTVHQLAGLEGWLEHPLLEKWLRDARMIEFMEGSTNIHKREVAKELFK